MDAKAVLKYAEDHEAKFVSVRFTDLVGSWQHLTFPIHELDEGSFEDGFGFDASSIRGWASIHESDMLLIPDAGRVWMEPFAEEPTLCVIANAVDPITKQGYGFDLVAIDPDLEPLRSMPEFRLVVSAAKAVRGP